MVVAGVTRSAISGHALPTLQRPYLFLNKLFADFFGDAQSSDAHGCTTTGELPYLCQRVGGYERMGWRGAGAAAPKPNMVRRSALDLVADVLNRVAVLATAL